MGIALKDNQILFESAARTATPSAFTGQTRYVGAIIVINVTAVTATPSVVFTLSGVDPASDSLWTILASAAITGTGQTVLRVHPSLTASANAIAKDIMPSTFKLAPVHGDADSITYSVGFIGVN
jgi:hypothetical protein